MVELSKEAKMIIASNLTVAAFVRDAAMTVRGDTPQFDTKDLADSKDLVTKIFAEILANLENQSLGKEHER